MNYNEYMKFVDEKLLSMSEMEKTEWIRNAARTTKEHQRNALLNSLKEEQGHKTIIVIKDIEDWCTQIENQEIYIECSSYEIYGENYWDSDYAYEYFDIFNIGNTLERAFKVAKELLFQRKFEQSLILYERLFNMSFSIFEKDIEEWGELDLESIVDEQLVYLDLKQIALNMMYSIYCVSKGHERSDKLYRYLSRDMCKKIKVEEIFSVGPEELKGLENFIKEWITFLKNADGKHAENLLLEACMYQGGISYLCETAKRVWEKHPGLYKYACQYLLDERNETDCEKLGLEAIHILPEKLIIRGEIANLTAKAAAQLKHVDVVKECYETAFYSESLLNHYLRLFEIIDCHGITDRGANYVKTLPESSAWEKRYNNNQMIVNTISKENKKVILFFNGEFDDIYEECKKDKVTLGWTNSFKGIAIPLFILLLNRNIKITKAGKTLINQISWRIGYKEEDDKSFMDRFLIWKEKVVLSKEQYDKYTEWIKEEVNERTDAIVGGGYRKSYYKAAILITALGETLQSNGLIQGKIKMIEHYKKMYSKKRAFKAELNELDDE